MRNVGATCARGQRRGAEAHLETFMCSERLERFSGSERHSGLGGAPAPSTSRAMASGDMLGVRLALIARLSSMSCHQR